MKPVEELDLILTLIHKYNLPLSPILEYAVSEKKEENYDDTTQNTEDDEVDMPDNTETSNSTIDPCIDVVDFDIPENADITTRNKFLMQFCYGILSDYQYALDEREKGICNLLLVENAKKRASKNYHITEERVRQIFVKSIKNINFAIQSIKTEVEFLRKKNDELEYKNEELRRRNYILQNEISVKSNIDVISQQVVEYKLCDNAKKLLAFHNEDLPFTNRTANVLRAAKVEFFKDIPQLTIEQVQKFKNCGKKTITELREFLSKYSLDFGMTYDDILSCMAKYVDDDFDPTLFVSQNKRILTRLESSQEVDAKKIKSPEINEVVAQSEESVVEQISLNSKGDIEGTSSFNVCSENRSGMPLSFNKEEGFVEQEFNGYLLAKRYYYPIQDRLFWDKNEHIYEIYLADNYYIIINHLIFDFDTLNQIETETEGLSEDKKEEVFSNYWYKNHINIIAKINPNTEGYDVLKLDLGVGIQEIAYEPRKYTCIKHKLDDDEKFIDFNGTVYGSAEQIQATIITDVAKYHNFYDAPNHITKEYIRFGMIEIKRIFKGTVKKISIFADSDLGQVIKNKSEDIWLIDANTIITKIVADESNSYPFMMYFRNGVKLDNEDLSDLKEKSLILQTQLNERINKLQSSLKKKKEKIRFERQLKEIMSTMFAFEDDENNNENSNSDNPQE